MNLTDRIKAFTHLGNFLHAITEQEFQDIADRARNENPWFTPESVRMALKGIREFLHGEKLFNWVAEYPEVEKPKNVAIVMAGNIPFVGFHDLLSVLISGHNLMVKLSSKDQFLPNFLLGKLKEIEPRFEQRIRVMEILKGFDAVIATGSDNSSRYFEYYFSKYPHIIRKNRTSVAILNGFESDEELQRVGSDVFNYFGLGCRNVSKLYVPREYVFNTMFENWTSYQDIVNHHKYCNNYDYQKSILLVNRQPFLDNGFVILQQSKNLVSPISVVFFDYYESEDQLAQELKSHQEKIQVIVGRNSLCDVDFGHSQFPGLTDYADNVDTMRFLTGLK
jgi:hypothetical protein